jgi:hypothetical protein
MLPAGAVDFPPSSGQSGRAAGRPTGFASDGIANPAQRRSSLYQEAEQAIEHSRHLFTAPTQTCTAE